MPILRHGLTALRRNGLAGGARHELHELPCCVLVLGVRIDRELEPVDGLLIFGLKPGGGAHARSHPLLRLDRAIAKEPERRHRTVPERSPS
jgi:hypothetical protein